MEKGNPNWVPGVSPNPNGRPKGSRNLFSQVDFKKAMEQVEQETQVPFWVHVHQEARKNNKVLIALINKMMPQGSFDPDEGFPDDDIVFAEIPDNGGGKERFKQYLEN
jgi:hypothetical protein